MTILTNSGGGPMTPSEHSERNGTVSDHAKKPGMTVGQVSFTDARRTVKTSERVALEIVHDIVARGLRTGDRLPLEAAMVEQYGVSRASLREALRLLEVQGLIRLKPGPGGGPVMGSVEPSHLARTAALYFHLGAATYGHLLDTQVLLEPLCAARAAQHPDRREVMAPFLSPPSPDDEPSYRGVTMGFHGAVYTLADNPVLTLLTQAVTHMVTHHVVATMDPVHMRQTILDEHVALARTIANGHVDRARRGMAEHFQAQHDYYREHWPARLAELIEWR
jgi:GntR family transcriptional regulator, transcriptional repressor for pyruvate dehydrogenase complex